MLDKNGFDFSFSGLKTAVARYVHKQRLEGTLNVEDTVCSFQESVVDVLVAKALSAVRAKKCGHLAVVGGVASNSRLRARIVEEAARSGIAVHIPSPALCTDNGAMVAAMGYWHLSQGKSLPLDLDVFSKMPRF